LNEWTKSPEDGGRGPWHIFLPGPRPFSFAGLWAHNKKPAVTSCTIITMPAGEPMRQLHDCQPVILEESAYDGLAGPGYAAGRGEGAAHRAQSRRRATVPPRKPGGEQCHEPGRGVRQPVNLL
jgi:hypothetical protein